MIKVYFSPYFTTMKKFQEFLEHEVSPLTMHQYKIHKLKRRDCAWNLFLLTGAHSHPLSSKICLLDMGRDGNTFNIFHETGHIDTKDIYKKVYPVQRTFRPFAYICNSVDELKKKIAYDLLELIDEFYASKAVISYSKKITKMYLSNYSEAVKKQIEREICLAEQCPSIYSYMFVYSPYSHAMLLNTLCNDSELKKKIKKVEKIMNMPFIKDVKELTLKIPMEKPEKCIEDIKKFAKN
jgi:hypothetical protein